jgi:exonuclease VII small subunit
MDQRDRDQLNQALAKFERGLELYAAGLRQLMALADKHRLPLNRASVPDANADDANADLRRHSGGFSS